MFKIPKRPMQFRKNPHSGVRLLKVYQCANALCEDEYYTIPVYCHKCGCTEFNEVEIN